MSIATPEAINARYRHCIQNRQKRIGEVAISWDPCQLDIRKHNKEEMAENMKQLRRQRKAGEIILLADNNQTRTVNGKTWYILVVQPTEDEALEINWFGMFVLDFMVGGHIIAFDRVENRDSVFHYVNGTKA